eukprot:sb/3468877/
MLISSSATDYELAQSSNPKQHSKLIYLLFPLIQVNKPIRTRYLGHVTGYQPIRDQYFLIWSARLSRVLISVFFSSSFTVARVPTSKNFGRTVFEVPAFVFCHVVVYQLLKLRIHRQLQGMICLDHHHHSYEEQENRGHHDGKWTSSRHGSIFSGEGGRERGKGRLSLSHRSPFRSLTSYSNSAFAIIISLNNLSIFLFLYQCRELTIMSDDHCIQEPTEPSKQPFRTRYLGHVTGYQPIRDQHSL